ncbi:MAG: cyclic nucleotide-binding domain-containing protein [Deltaproteobacteria bacterium]|nr:cyclic nucleotide-binding domain-containing protein [Deltaproteobacteria bacterium]
MQKIGDLLNYAREEANRGELARALHAYGAVIQLQPLNLDARQRVGEVLLALGRPQEAAIVWTALAKLCTHGGHPLRAIVAIKLLSALEPALEGLLRVLAELYAAGSPRLGKGARLSAGDINQPLPPSLDLSRPPPLPNLIDAVVRLASDLSGMPFIEKLPPIPVLSTLSASAFQALLSAVGLFRALPGTAIIREGEPGNAFYMLASGEVRVLKRNSNAKEGFVELARLHDGAVFGEMALLSAAPRSATVEAVRESDLLQFHQDALRKIAAELPSVASALDHFARERLLNNILATSPLFAPLDRSNRMALLRRFSSHDVPEGAVIIREGEEGKGLFVVIAGEVEVIKETDGTPLSLGTLGPGEVFGEISLIDQRPATATVRATRPSTVLFLDRVIFWRLIEVVPEIREYLMRLSEERLMDARLSLESLELKAWEIPIEIDEEENLP